MVVSLNRKRRIFRPTVSVGSTLELGRPTRQVVLAALGGAALLGATLWLVGRPSEAPAQGPTTGRLVVGASDIAVVDGQTLRLRDRVVRLDGVTSPPRGETCRDRSGQELDCGAAATNALAALVRDAGIDCTLRGRDPNGRPLATCVTLAGPVNQALVLAGWARADVSAPALVTAESQARAARRGLWAMEPVIR